LGGGRPDARAEPDHAGGVDLDHWLQLEYKVTAVQVSLSNGPGEWQESDREQCRTSRRAKLAPAD